MVISVLPILVISSLTYYLSSVYLTRQITLLIEDNLSQVKRNIDTHIEGYRYLLYQTYSDDSLFSMIRGFGTGTMREKAIIKNAIKSHFFSIAFNKEEIQALTFIWNDDDIVGYVKGTESLLDSPFFRPEVKGLLGRTGRSAKRVSIIPTMKMLFPMTTPVEKDLFHLVLPFYDLKARNVLGVFTLSIDEAVLTDICSGTADSLVFIVGNDGRIVSFPDKRYIGRRISDIAPGGSGAGEVARLSAFVKSTGILPSGKILINRLQVTEPDWTIVSAVDRDVFFREVNALQRTSLLLIGGFILVSLIVILLFARNFSQAVTELVSVMKNAQNGNFVRAEKLERRNDEFALIARGFDDMISEIRELMNNLEREKNNVYAATQMQKESEIRALEAQINPHFLYNTLDCINWMAIDKGDFEISDMLSKLGQILRYGINRSNGVVDIGSEVKWLEEYIFLQRTRFNGAFSLEIEVDPAVRDFQVYKLLMQPFIENAILHGFDGSKRGGLISVKIAPGHRGGVRIEIRDNGRGMDRAELESAISPESSHIGIRNALDRVAIYYGDAGDVRIESEPGKGTTVVLDLPPLGTAS